MGLDLTIKELAEMHGSERIVVRITTLRHLTRLQTRLSIANRVRMREHRSVLKMTHSISAPNLWIISVKRHKDSAYGESTAES